MTDLGAIFLDYKIGVVFTCGLLLSPEQEEHAIKINQQIAEKNKGGLKFVLDKEKHPPYVRLYEVVLPKHNVETAVDRMRKLAEKMPQFDLHWAQVEETENFVAIWGHADESIKLFQETVLLELDSLREGFFKEKYIKEIDQQKFTEAEKKSFIKWGSPWAEPYIPHMILAKSKSVFNVNAYIPVWEFKSCTLSGLFVGVGSEDYKSKDFSEVFRFPFAG